MLFPEKHHFPLIGNLCIHIDSEKQSTPNLKKNTYTRHSISGSILLICLQLFITILYAQDTVIMQEYQGPVFSHPPGFYTAPIELEIFIQSGDSVYMEATAGQDPRNRSGYTPDPSIISQGLSTGYSPKSTWIHTNASCFKR